MRVTSRLLIVWTLAGLAAPFDGSLSAQTASRGSTSLAPVPFAGCPSDGQTGPVDAPTTSVAEARVEAVAGLAARLTLYGSATGIAVLGPRGWFCAGTFGSAQDSLVVTPMPIGRAAASTEDVGIRAIRAFGDTSGRFTVAQLAARVFPAARSFVDHVVAEGRLPASDFPSGPFPGDRLTYRSDHIVEYETPARSEGLGTFFHLSPTDRPVRGVAVFTPDSTIRYVAVRLTPNLDDLAPVIIEQYEAQR